MQPWQNAIMADPGFAQQRAWWAAKRAARAARKVISDRRGRGIVPPKMMFFPRDNTFGYVPGKRPYRGGYKRRYGGGFKRRFKRFGRRRFGSRWGRRRSSRRYGRGGYWGDWVGRKLGGYFGLGDLGGRIGSWGGDRLQSWLGLGSYAKRASGYGGYYDSQIGATYEHDQDIPIMSNPGGTDGPVVIRHKEYIGDIVSTGSAFNLGYKIAITQVRRNADNRAGHVLRIGRCLAARYEFSGAKKVRSERIKGVRRGGKGKRRVETL